MNPCSPVWNFEGDLPVPNQKTHMGFGPDNELVEILWRNGQVVLNSQTHRKPSLNPNGSRQVSGSYGKSSNLIQDDETVSWIQSPVEDSFEKDFYSTFFSEMPPPRSELDDEAAHRSKSLGGPGKAVHFSPPKGEFGFCNGELGRKGFGNSMQGEISHCGSNQVAYDLDASRASSSGVRIRTPTTSLSPGNLKDDIRKAVIPQGEKAKTETLDPTVTSSSGGSGSSFDRTSNKRKRRDAGESECQSEGAELESAAGNKSAQKSGGSCRRSRAAEVHNLSERRRRDRINEKMKALQELIPHCNKTDKASMLDEAIEYLKSLQLQLQVMWMGSGGMVAPMMFPGVQHYMSRMGMGMGPAVPLPSITNPMHLSRLPLVDQSMSMAAQAQNQAVMNQVHYQNQMQNPNFTNPYARCMGFHHMQTPSQPVNMFRYGSPAVQSQVVTPPSSSCGAFTGGAAPDNAMPL